MTAVGIGDANATSDRAARRSTRAGGAGGPESPDHRPRAGATRRVALVPHSVIAHVNAARERAQDVMEELSAVEVTIAKARRRLDAVSARLAADLRATGDAAQIAP